MHNKPLLQIREHQVTGLWVPMLVRHYVPHEVQVEDTWRPTPQVVVAQQSKNDQCKKVVTKGSTLEKGDGRYNECVNSLNHEFSNPCQTTSKRNMPAIAIARWDISPPAIGLHPRSTRQWPRDSRAGVRRGDREQNLTPRTVGRKCSGQRENPERISGGRPVAASPAA